MENNKMEIETLGRLKEMMKFETGEEMDLKDSDFLRFLRARNYQVDKAERMLREHLKWKETVKFDQAGSWETPEILVQSFPCYLDGVDKDGRAVFYIPVGLYQVHNWDAAGIQETVRYVHHTLAKCMESIERTVHEQFMIILDQAGMSYKHFANYGALQFLLRTFREYEQNFPDRLHSAIIINAPWAWNIILPSVKAIFGGGTLTKIQLFDSNYSNYLPMLLESIPYSGMPTGFKKKYAEIFHSFGMDD